nr:hypothetical protein [uncultured Campylobacter sp.]
MSKLGFVEHKERYERSEIYKTAFCFSLTRLPAAALFPDTPSLLKISDVSARYTRIQLPHEIPKLRVKF